MLTNDQKKRAFVLGVQTYAICEAINQGRASGLAADIVIMAELIDGFDLPDTGIDKAVSEFARSQFGHCDPPDWMPADIEGYDDA